MIKFIGIEKTYDSPSGKVHALKGIDLNIARGKMQRRKSLRSIVQIFKEVSF